jgi:hypothetical protein
VWHLCAAARRDCMRWPAEGSLPQREFQSRVLSKRSTTSTEVLLKAPQRKPCCVCRKCDGGRPSTSASLWLLKRLPQVCTASSAAALNTGTCTKKLPNCSCAPQPPRDTLHLPPRALPRGGLFSAVLSTAASPVPAQPLLPGAADPGWLAALFQTPDQVGQSAPLKRPWQSKAGHGQVRSS